MSANTGLVPESDPVFLPTTAWQFSPFREVGESTSSRAESSLDSRVLLVAIHLHEIGRKRRRLPARNLERVREPAGGGVGGSDRGDVRTAGGEDGKEVLAFLAARLDTDDASLS